MAHPEIKAVDLFCGVGGLTVGLRRSGIRVVAGYDLDPDCRYPYTRNNPAPFFLADVGRLGADDLTHHFRSARFTVLAGCAPCQPFSSYSRPTRSEDSRWQLVREFVRLACSVKPDVVTMENVPQLLEHRAFRTARSLLRAAGYHVTSQIVDCSVLGVPQTRRRLVVLASQHGEIPFAPRSGKMVTVREALQGMEPLTAGQQSESDPLHRCCDLSPINLKRVRASKPGGSWRDWPDTLLADCHRRSSGSTFPSVYGRMSWNEPAPTMTTQYFGYGNGRFGHPAEDRALSLREGALLQTFPRHYHFEAPGERLSAQRLGKLIGNAVPPRLGRAIGGAIRRHIRDLG